MADANGSQSAYLTGPILSTGSQSVFVRGGQSQAYNYQLPGYILGADVSTSSLSGYLDGHGASNSQLSSYLAGSGSYSSSLFAFLSGEVGSTITAYLKGQTMAVDYIKLKTSDNLIEKKFHVLQEGYDDGTLEKAESIQRTIGGGLNHSVGAVYKRWTAIIRVRHTETESGYGNMADLEYFFSLNNPNGTPSDVITFTDHHSVEYQVKLFGTLQKSLLGTNIEGTNAWSTVGITMGRIHND